MKFVLSLLAILSFNSGAFASTHDACEAKVFKAASVLYQLNNPTSARPVLKVDPISSAPSESGVITTWKASFSGESVAPYVFQTASDNCILFNFAMPDAG